MLQFKYPVKSDAVTELEDRLQQLSLAFKSEMDAALEMPILIEGTTTISGLQNIVGHLDQLAGELYIWRHRNC